MPTTVAPVCVCGHEQERHYEDSDQIWCLGNIACPCVLYVPGCSWCGDPLSEDAVEEGRRFCGEECALSEGGQL